MIDVNKPVINPELVMAIKAMNVHFISPVIISPVAVPSNNIEPFYKMKKFWSFL